MKKKNKALEKETYIAPSIEVVEIEIEQNILKNGSGKGLAPTSSGEDWF